MSLPFSSRNVVSSQVFSTRGVNADKDGIFLSESYKLWAYSVSNLPIKASVRLRLYQWPIGVMLLRARAGVFLNEIQPFFFNVVAASHGGLAPFIRSCGMMEPRAVDFNNNPSRPPIPARAGGNLSHCQIISFPVIRR